MTDMTESNPALVIIAALAKSTVNAYKLMDDHIAKVTGLRQSGIVPDPELLKKGQDLMDSFTENLDVLSAAADDILGLTMDELPNEDSPDTRH
jgi:hypothetical protein